MNTSRIVLVLFALGAAAVTAWADGLPRLVDLGAGKCIPCKRMKPILDGLKKDYANQFDVEFIDVWENRDSGEKYGVRIIPTQIFYSADGRELFRHEGYFSREDILEKWKELGVGQSQPNPAH
jgi:thioredoxin 1